MTPIIAPLDSKDMIMAISRRSYGKLFALALASAGIAATTACDSESDSDSGDLTKVNFGYIGDFNGASLLAVAEDQGLWKKYGLEASTKVFTNGPLQIQALGTGDLDFGYIGPGAMWLPASGKAKVVSVNTIGAADRVIAQPGITSLQQLKGKKVAVPEGTSGDMILTLALESVGMTVSDVEKVPMDASTVVSAFSSGQVDAAGIWYPLISTIKNQVPDLVELAKNEDFSDTVSFMNAFVASTAVVADKSDLVTNVVKVLRDAMDYRAANLTDAVKLTATMLKLTEEDVTADAANSKVLTSQELDTLTNDGSVVKWMTGLNAYFVQAGKLTEPVDPTTYYLGSVFTEAASK